MGLLVSPPLSMSIPAAGPRPVLRVTDVIGLILGTVLGDSIFRTPSLVASNAGSEGAFLFAWARLAVIQKGSIALLAFIVGDYAGRLAEISPFSPSFYTALVIVLLTGLNAAGIRPGSAMQNILASGVVLGLLVVVGTGLTVTYPDGPPGNVFPSPQSRSSAFGLCMVFVLLTYGGWNEAAYLSAEVVSPGRNMVRGLVWSILIVTGLYLLVNWAYLRGLGHAGVAASTAVAADLVKRGRCPFP
ncbi:MAG: amino acid permease [Syntrophaceae bacterium]|nr:amino acid permease [Syntrophaceae bacterium]